jgi:hypothetical protein
VRRGIKRDNIINRRYNSILEVLTRLIDPKHEYTAARAVLKQYDDERHLWVRELLASA